MNRLHQSIAYTVFLVALLVFGFRSPLMLSCADTGWHLLSGNFILDNKRIPFTDPWSFTTSGYQWMNLSWMWDSLMALLERAGGGLELPLAANILVNSITIALVFQHISRRHVSALASILLLPLALISFSFGAALRPQQVSYLFLAILLSMLFAEDAPRPRRRTLRLALLFLLWANMHGGFLLGLLVTCCWSIEQAFRSKFDRRTLQHVALCSGSAIIAVLCNPLGVRVFEAAFRTLRGPLRAIISEWQPLPWDAAHAWYLSFTVLAFVSLVLTVRAERLSLTERALAFAAIVETFIAQRHLPILVIAALPVCGIFIDKVLRGVASHVPMIALRLEGFDEDLARPRTAAFFFSASCFGAAGLLLLGFLRMLPADIPAEYPSTEVEFMQNAGPKYHWMNFYFDGGYLLYRSKGTLSLFIDGRAETAFSPEVVRDYLNFYMLGLGWTEILDRYAIDGVVVPPDSSWAMQLAELPGWRLAFKGPVRLIYLRSEPH